MNMTPRQEPVKCKARKQDGTQCKAWPIKGAEVCRVHGGRAPQVKAAAARRLAAQAAEQAVRTLGLPVDVSPTEALLEEVRWTAGHVAWLRGKVQELAEEPTHRHVTFDGEDDVLLETPGQRGALVWGTTKVKTGGEDAGTTQEAKPSLWYELYARERAHLIRVCSEAIRAGVEERRVRLAEQQGDLLALAIRRILEAFGLGDDPRVATIVPGVLREIGAGR